MTIITFLPIFHMRNLKYRVFKNVFIPITILGMTEWGSKLQNSRAQFTSVDVISSQ